MKKNKCRLLPYIKENIYGDYNQVQNKGWEIDLFKVTEQWKYSDGENVVVGVIDTGIDFDHPDISTNIIDGKNFVQKWKKPIDGNSHGTHVAGTICANNNSIGMVGVAPKTKIVPIKALDDNGSGQPNHIADAIVWAVDSGVDIITMSLGSAYPIPVIHEAVKYAELKNVVIFAAAGNSGIDHEISYPAAFEETVSIGAIDMNFNRTEFTCSGNELDFLAPGYNIFSTVPGGYALMSGTSMSNPFAVGCAALLLSYVKNNNINIKLNCAQDYIDVLKIGTMHLKNPQFQNQKKYEGYGIINPSAFKYWMHNVK